MVEMSYMQLTLHTINTKVSIALLDDFLSPQLTKGSKVQYKVWVKLNSENNSTTFFGYFTGTWILKCYIENTSGNELWF